MSEQILMQILGELKSVNQRLDSMDQRFDNMDQRFDNMDQRLDNMDQRLDNMDQRLCNVEQRLGNVEHRLGNVEQRLDNVETSVDDLKKSQARLEFRMENEVIEKIRALFDAREVHEDKFKQVFKRLDDIALDTGYLVAKVAQLERIAR